MLNCDIENIKLYYSCLAIINRSSSNAVDKCRANFILKFIIKVR